MSFVERALFLFGVVGMLADFTVLFTFATGISNLHDYIPQTIPTPSAELFFSLTTGLIIIYGWFIVSWYLIRRTFVLLGQMPVRFNYPLVNRSLRTVSGVGFVLIPLTIAWSVVNLPDSYINNLGIIRLVAFTPTVQSTTTGVSIVTETPQAPLITPTPKIITSPAPVTGSGWGFYFTLCFPFFLLLFGFVVWLPINLLMPIVHVELLLQEASPEIMDALKEYFEQ
jgi:hypothetical protein